MPARPRAEMLSEYLTKLKVPSERPSACNVEAPDDDRLFAHVSLPASIEEVSVRHAEDVHHISSEAAFTSRDSSFEHTSVISSTPVRLPAASTPTLENHDTGTVELPSISQWYDGKQVGRRYRCSSSMSHLPHTLRGSLVGNFRNSNDATGPGAEMDAMEHSWEVMDSAPQRVFHEHVYYPNDARGRKSNNGLEQEEESLHSRAVENPCVTVRYVEFQSRHPRRESTQNITNASHECYDRYHHLPTPAISKYCNRERHRSRPMGIEMQDGRRYRQTPQIRAAAQSHIF